ncbi:YitT family protein [Cellulosilyticum sp. I15G10I2]|uniref:YitT family protein n=1 Tax=Cellulosilyticum sp. I15G10I2 TaxID=1892843 RepID=UPI00085BFACC|nr:YitT family protein [Cellulosilyticum sp. I15G10I2]
MNDHLFNIKRILSIIFGTLLISIAINGIFVPNKLLSGGVTGIAILFHFIFNFKVSLVVLILNIPLFIIGSFFLKKTYLSYSVFGMIMLSLWLELTSSLIIHTNNILSILVIGGFLYGAGIGIIFKSDGSTGGIDIIAKIVNKYFSINMATVTFFINNFIILLSIFLFGVDIAVTTISTMFIGSRITNFVVDGINHKRTLFIITDSEHYEAISNHIIQNVHRGVTVIPAIGAYTTRPKYILYTTVGLREVAKVKQLILKHDPNAFMTVSETAQVIGKGKGFLHLDTD